MKPFPKVVSILSIAASVFAALNSTEVLTLLPKNISAFIMLGAAVTSALAHSLTGSGGKPEA